MKKIFAYTLTAVLLGAVIMLFPLRILYASYGEEGPIAGTAPYLRTFSELEGLQKPDGNQYYDTIKTSQPTDPFVGILAVSFFVALVAYLLFRRRRPDSSYRYSQFLRRF